MYLDQVFPALQYFFKSGIHQKAVYAILEESPSANQIASLHLIHLKNPLVSNSHGRFKKEMALELRVLAQKSVGTAGKSLSVQITQSIARIELLESQIDAVESEIKDIVSSLDSPIMTIPGIGPVNGGMILGEIGDINRFSKPRKLLAFADLDPSVYLSGNFSAKKTRLSKRGSSALRYALMNAAHNVVKNNQTFRNYYDSKRAESRGHYNALGHCAGKLVRVIYKMLKDDVKYNLE